MRAKILISTFIFFLSIELSCGSDESCKRDCSKAVRNDNVILEVMTAEAEGGVICNGYTGSVRRVTRFKAYTKDGSENKTPKGYVMITPKLDDGTGGNWISAEYDQEDHSNSIGRLRGIITKSSDFCTDSCGIVEIEYALRCPSSTDSEQKSTVDLSVSTGSTSANNKVEITQKALSK